MCRVHAHPRGGVRGVSNERIGPRCHERVLVFERDLECEERAERAVRPDPEEHATEEQQHAGDETGRQLRERLRGVGADVREDAGAVRVGKLRLREEDEDGDVEEACDKDGVLYEKAGSVTSSFAEMRKRVSVPSGTM